MKKFAPMEDLSDCTKEQEQQYYQAACEYFDIPAELNLLYFDLVDSGDGARKKVLCAKKGFTDIMRSRMSIETDSLDESISDGVVRYKCKGHDKTGRHEIAVGASTIIGLTGRKLEDSFAKAQTKATRRMTMQFVGAGVLDESEVPVRSISTDISSANLPLAQLPTVEVNTAKGKDVTLTEAMVNGAVNRAIDLVNQQHPLAGQAVEVAQAMTKAVNESLYPDNASGSLFPETKTEIASGELRRKPGPVRGEDLNAPVSTAVVTFKAWLFWITNEVLPLPPSGQSSTFTTYGGMKPSIGVGGVSMKVRAFARKIFPGKELDKLSVEEQNEFKLLFENKLKEVGSKGLVQYINDMLGVKSE